MVLAEFCFNLLPVSAGAIKLDILAAVNTNSRRLIRIWRSWGLIPSRNRKQGWVCYFSVFVFFVFEDKVLVQNPKVVILVELL